MNKKFIKEVLTYGAIGAINTLLTAIIIWSILKWGFGVTEEKASPVEMAVSNLSGYTVGLIISFICNRKWTFKSKEKWKTGFLKFLVGFGICYVIQLLVVLFLNKYGNIPSIRFNISGQDYSLTSSYVCQLIGIVTYTSLNFFYNKYYTFKK